MEPMSLRVYNTLSQEKEEFAPLVPGQVRMYVCGPTVYDESHVGHARSAVVFDVIFRYLKFLNYEVTYVRNYTDVDDKIIAKANAEGKPAKEIAEFYIADYDRDMASLGVDRPTVTPRVTEVMPEIVKLVESLVAKGFAYPAGGDVFFSVRKFPGYGKLSKRTLDEMEAGARVEINEAKQDPLDFALWKASKPGEPSWDSPWGKGRPGWHIECSAMSGKFLGETFDIHGGGRDLIFPHHENEIAQSEAAFGRPMARHWLHNGFVNINKEKMSKSLGNFLTIKQVIQRVHPEALRLFFFSAHYRSPVDFSEESLRDAQDSLDKFYSVIAKIAELSQGRSGSGDPGASPELVNLNLALKDDFIKAMDDDFNTAKAIANFFEAFRIINSHLNNQSFLKKPDAIPHLKVTADNLVGLANILGLLREDPIAYCQAQQKRCLVEIGITPAEIELKIVERAEARKQKDFASADRVRSELSARGIALEDGPKGTTWRVEKKISEKS
jgi:cysteinyl-tRNA synthetase